MKLSLVVPCYNEAENIAQLHSLIVQTFQHVSYAYEIIFVDDGSADGTGRVLQTLFDTSEHNIKVIYFSRNFGKEAAIYAGMQAAKGDYVTLIDADLQQDPAIARQMVQLLEDDPELDCVTAYQEQRGEGKGLAFFKRCFYKLMDKLTDVEFHQGASDFRTMRKSMVEAVLKMSEANRFSKGIFAWVGFRNRYIPYSAAQRACGKSKWSFWKLFKYAIDGIVSFSTAPLRIVTAVGVITSLCSVLYMLVVIFQKLVFDIAVSGYATIVVLILFLGGMQLFGLGIIGEYLARTYVETKRRPVYIARCVLDYTDRQTDAAPQKNGELPQQLNIEANAGKSADAKSQGLS